MLLVIGLGFFLLFFVMNILARRTNTYKNYYRTIHVVKDVSQNSKYMYGAFGSTFAYYAYDLKKYQGHNFSVEPQSMIYMEKTINHFVGNIEKGGYAFISLVGCLFAAESTFPDEQCTVYQSFLTKEEIGNESIKRRIKYYLKRYFPILSPNYIKAIMRDEEFKYSIDVPLKEEEAIVQARKRIMGWENIVGMRIDENFVSKKEDVIKNNIVIIRRIVKMLKNQGIIPIFVVLPMSKVFNDVCPKKFYEEILYRSLAELNDENVKVMDYLYDEELGKLEYYYTADCLNKTGRNVFTERLIKDIS